MVALLPGVVLVLAAAGLTMSRHRRTEHRRYHTLELTSCLVAGLGMAGLILWERQLGLPRLAVRGAAFFIVGVMCALTALSGRARRVYAASALALIPFGAVLPLCSGPQIGLAGGFAMIVAGLATAGIQAWQLRAEGRAHEPAAD